MFPSDFPFIEYLLDLVYDLLDSIYEKSTTCSLVSDRTNFAPPSWNIDQVSLCWCIDVNPIQINVPPHVNSPRTKKKWDVKIRNKSWQKILYASFVQLSIYYFPSHLKETQIQKKQNQKNLINERKTFLWITTKLCRTQTSLGNFNCMYNKKAHMLKIYYSLKTINFLKIKRVVLKHDVSTGMPWKKCRPKCTLCFKLTQIKIIYPREIEKFLKGKAIGAT